MALQPTSEGDWTFATDQPFALERGGSLQPVTLHYALYGKLNARRDNAVLVCHALSGSARIADWWPEMFSYPATPSVGVAGAGPAAAGDLAGFDTGRYCFLCANILGSCYGSTGPGSIDPRIGRPFGPDFPLITVADMVRSQALLLDHLGIERVHAVIGGSIGGMQALQWAVDYPQRLDACIAIGATPLSAMGLALNHLQRQAIVNDPAFQNGRYTQQPARGLSLARQIAMASYKSAELFAERYGRQPDRSGEDPYRSAYERFDVAGYLDYQGEKFVARFDANAYLSIMKSMDTFEMEQRYGSQERAWQRIRAKVLLIGISSDWLFPAADVRALGDRMLAAGVDCEYQELISNHGHDGFLADPGQLVHLLKPVFAQAQAKVLNIR